MPTTFQRFWKTFIKHYTRVFHHKKTRDQRANGLTDRWKDKSSCRVAIRNWKGHLHWRNICALKPQVDKDKNNGDDGSDDDDDYQQIGTDMKRKDFASFRFD